MSRQRENFRAISVNSDVYDKYRDDYESQKVALAFKGINSLSGYICNLADKGKNIHNLVIAETEPASCYQCGTKIPARGIKYMAFDSANMLFPVTRIQVRCPKKHIVEVAVRQ